MGESGALGIELAFIVERTVVGHRRGARHGRRAGADAQTPDIACLAELIARQRADDRYG
jgi:hypothetical protein